MEINLSFLSASLHVKVHIIICIKCTQTLQPLTHAVRVTKHSFLSPMTQQTVHLGRHAPGHFRESVSTAKELLVTYSSCLPIYPHSLIQLRA